MGVMEETTWARTIWSNNVAKANNNSNQEGTCLKKQTMPCKQCQAGQQQVESSKGIWGVKTTLNSQSHQANN